MAAENLTAALAAFEQRTGVNKLVLAAVCILLLDPGLLFEPFQLVFVALGAAAYALSRSRTLELRAPYRSAQADVSRAARAKTQPAKYGKLDEQSDSNDVSQEPTVSHGRWKPTKQPVQARKFEAKDWDACVQELLQQLRSTPASEQVVARIADRVGRAVRDKIPEAEVLGFANGDLDFMQGTAFGVAVPDVDIVVRASPRALCARLRTTASTEDQALSAMRVQKSAIRACADALIAHGFKFRRSAFRCEEPKVTLLVPESLGIHGQSIPISLSVNGHTPIQNSVLTALAARFDSRVEDLILLVRRWAKDRAISHEAKGHLPPFVWTILVMYYCQVGVDDEAPLVPPLVDFDALIAQDQQPREPAPATSPRATPVSTLLKGFVNFYARRFDVQHEAVSLRAGRRAEAHAGLRPHLMRDATGESVMAPTIEDPFNSQNNLSERLDAAAWSRFQEEMERAEALLSNDVSFEEFLEPWAPPLEKAEAELAERP